VVEALDKSRIEPGTLYFACAGYHLSVEQDLSFSLSCEAPLHYSRPSIDILMESAADAYGERLLGIVLSGANHDGAAGLARIKRMGGMTVVQNPEQAQAGTMPRAAIELTQPDLILPLQEIHSLLLTLEKH
jgi:two-component system chemotaxis response regulator CheB